MPAWLGVASKYCIKMVKKYDPEAFLEYPYCDSYSIACSKMVESRYGEWVKLKTYIDETDRLKKQIERLQNHQKKLHTKLAESIHISDLTTLTPEDIQERYYAWVNK